MEGPQGPIGPCGGRRAEGLIVHRSQQSTFANNLGNGPWRSLCYHLLPSCLQTAKPNSHDGWIRGKGIPPSSIPSSQPANVQTEAVRLLVISPAAVCDRMAAVRCWLVLPAWGGLINIRQVCRIFAARKDGPSRREKATNRPRPPHPTLAGSDLGTEGTERNAAVGMSREGTAPILARGGGDMSTGRTE